MCGIIAAASSRNVGKLLVQGLHRMEYRGYDSAGIALHQEQKNKNIAQALKNLNPSEVTQLVSQINKKQKKEENDQ